MGDDFIGIDDTMFKATTAFDINNITDVEMWDQIKDGRFARCPNRR